MHEPKSKQLCLFVVSRIFNVIFIDRQSYNPHSCYERRYLTMSSLTPRQLVLLANVIPVQEMIKIGEGFLGIDHTKIENIKFENRDDAEAISRQILRVWCYKHNSNQLQVGMLNLISNI